MKRENNSILIYSGAILFFIIAVTLGVIMYKTEIKNREINNIANQEQQNEETKNVSTEIGQKVEEKKEDTVNENATINKETDTNVNTNTTNNKNVNENTINNKNETKNKNTKKEDSKKVEENTEKNITETKKDITFTKPTDGEIICEFAKDNLIYSETLKEWITHTAIDIKADKTSIIKASADGIVKSIVNDPRYGLTVVMQHDDGYETVYSNLLTAEFVVEGEEVKQGQTIGTAGNTASFESEMESHLHFELLKDGQYLDPNIYLK